MTIASYGVNEANAAFFPLYPLVMRFVNVPLTLLLPNLDTMPRTELARFLTASLSSLAAALGLFALLSKFLAEDDAWRGVFYFLIYPTALFLLQVYFEALFIMSRSAALVIYTRILGRLRQMLKRAGCTLLGVRH